VQVLGVDLADPFDQSLAELVVRPVLPVAHFLELAGHSGDPAAGVAGTAASGQLVAQAAGLANGFV
jgi:hypothetical protein